MSNALISLERSLDKVEREVKKNKFIYMNQDFESFSEEDKILWYYKYKEYMVTSKLLSSELHHAYNKIEYLKWLLREKKRSKC